MQPPGGPPSRNTSYHRPNPSSREKDQAMERWRERDVEVNRGATGRGVEEINSGARRGREKEEGERGGR